MNFEMQKAIMLAEGIKGFIQFVQKNYENKNSFRINTDKLYKIKLITEDFKFQIIADELLRINQFDWDGKYTYYLVNQFREGYEIIEEYVKNNYEDLFLITARMHSLKSLSSSFSR
ncbi:hypothetical protein [Bacillus sp. MRMR6]|uniref:hypothetical protein n=1 Tax=Bacillus sp. MRMR6 TaxID=1928617 RepID=UPI000952614A|nr:hypothetical protein [Bacillus sp. MRMR6]OLS34852.1 hypothetical protein BTR25_21050 [Bacillus sp. MRMR6]